MTTALLNRSLTVDRIERLVEAEFHEMPGMRLTEGQVRRIWNLRPTECAMALARMVGTGRLCRDVSGRYTRTRLSR
jgi:hypothetical protein